MEAVLPFTLWSTLCLDSKSAKRILAPRNIDTQSKTTKADYLSALSMNLLKVKTSTKDHALSIIGDLSRDASRNLSSHDQILYSQYFTEGVIAQTMAQRLTLTGKTLSIGDHGAGAGILGTTTLIELMSKHARCALNLTAYEIDRNLHSSFFNSIDVVERYASDCGSIIPYSRLNGDFTSTNKKIIEERSNSLDGAIINPPYQKLNQGSELAHFMRNNFVSVPNMYALFVVLTVDMLKDNGEMVAILPRSFMSGAYFKSFREWLRSKGSIDWFHRYVSRSNAFRGDNVLQENVLIKFKKSKAQEKLVDVSISNGPNEKDCQSMKVLSDVIFSRDPQGHMTLPSSELELKCLEENDNLPYSVDDLGLSISTGKFEDFRNKEYLFHEPATDSLPVVYAQHWKQNEVSFAWSSAIKKPCFAAKTTNLNKRAIKRGNYVLVKRISANSDAARCHSVALLEDSNLPGNNWLIDNHIQVISTKAGLSKEQAIKIQRHLSSELVELLLRTKSGTTQLNKDDISAIRFPYECSEH